MSHSKGRHDMHRGDRWDVKRLRVSFFLLAFCVFSELVAGAEDEDSSSENAPHASSAPAESESSTTAPAEPEMPTTAPADSDFPVLPEELPADAPEAVRATDVIVSKAVGTSREGLPPSYVLTLDKLAAEYGWEGFEEYDWLELGFEHRSRFERGDSFYRRDAKLDDRPLMRTRGFVGVRDVLDPLRFGFEFQDARRFQDNLEPNSRDTDETDILQAFAELYLGELMNRAPPLRLRVGRMSADLIDRRLVARNRFRNTTNSFDGVLLQLDHPDWPWGAALFATQPVNRYRTARDESDDDRRFYGLVGYWREKSPDLILEPYYFALDQEEHVDSDGADQPDRELHTIGAHGFGLIGESGFDYDFDVALQFGRDDDRDHGAYASHAELGYTFDHDWTPRLAAWLNYASGDDDPYDSKSKRFDNLFGASHTMYGYSGLFTWENMINPTVAISARPMPKVFAEVFYRWFWLASDQDSFERGGLQDPTGESGDFIGQEVDLHLRVRLSRRTEFDMGYSHFVPGNFVRNTGEAGSDSDFFYVQMILRF